MNLFHQQGVATIPTIMALAILIVVLGISIAATGFTESAITKSQNASVEAIVYAEAGAHDALQRIARDKDYNCTSENCLQLDLKTNGCSNSDGCATITVSNDDGATNTPKIITSVGEAGDSTRTIQVSVILNSDGQMTQITWDEVTN
ncbi:MAG: hypothetical protein COT81_02340 [Candidatus Buchananbacteria bacterium CG10_big_fil_rev_8_21_14_0_10_42_9]|uniref:Type 4 fimbrial biogenesis protein PilX N-terminal domain-containing protein n=1 Tax=Candidatus Buchananbacteria bacterium CG10_big_fil_rev_8_21_14_0_10_42_9 TaxID=1974526 RepID=A0A2H0W1K0_9BACT|nr:MAG: hypothetical protein COT81_02340 [Candidatus Buchananbacteria bacterium CG10_big_fil_rev_8_21_14_0_10_42_9]